MKGKSGKATRRSALAGGMPVKLGNGHRRRSVQHDFVKSLAFTLTLLAAKFFVEYTIFGEHIERMTYDLLQHRLLTTHPTEDLPVVIVDISRLEIASSQSRNNAIKATPRVALRRLLKATAEQWPRAIGVDIDFSPDAQGYVTPDDPDFFQFCLNLQRETGVSILLGIQRSQALPPGDWLGHEGYRELATSIMIPKDGRRMLRWIQLGDNTSRRLTMSAALAEAVEKWDFRVPKWLSWGVRQFSEKRLSEDLSVGEFLIDYSPLEALEKERLRTKNPDVISDQGWLLHDKVVIIGDATIGKASDTFVIPDRPSPFPGIYIHACAAYTLIKAPLYELTGGGRLFIDVFLSLIVFGIVALVRLYYKDSMLAPASIPSLQFVLTWLVAALVVLGGALLVRRTRLIWDDFILVTALLISHVRVERSMEKLGVWVRNTFGSA